MPFVALLSLNIITQYIKGSLFNTKAVYTWKYVYISKVEIMFIFQKYRIFLIEGSVTMP